ncbi:hypothetical protein VNI00_003553 [Paramarasmius palmivorus]|uniref:Glycoside hydrolase family 1 protein n=1 Tax=Paramarasmius palmivorus TaxID=297713 RepID=A0AAW0DSW8_9AGAR
MSKHFLRLFLSSICLFEALASNSSDTSTSFQPAASNSSVASSAPTGTVTAPPAGGTFPAVGNLERRYSPEDLEVLWDLVGPVTPPPFTTTRVPDVPVALPSPPPPLYPSWFAPEPKDILPTLKFPKGFIFGVDTAAYQVEGAAKDDGKGPTNWDWASRQPGYISDNTTVIDYSLELGIEPVVTLFHWDMPLALQAYYGGFTSEEIVDDFVNYAKTVFKAYNGRVKTWFTFNEPRVFCSRTGQYPFSTRSSFPRHLPLSLLANLTDVSLPAGVNSSTAPYQCSYYLLKAHAGAVKAFREMNITGEISLKNDDYVGTPWRANSTEDAEAVERRVAFQIGVFSDPVYKGDWPKILTDTLPESYLPRFTEEEKRDIFGSADFYAIDSYRSEFVAAPDDGIEACVSNPSHRNWPTCFSGRPFDSGAGWAVGPSSDPGASWLTATPNRMRPYLGELQRRWPTKKMYITEFGFSEPFEGLRQPQQLYRIKEDVARTDYFMTYLGEILLAIHEDNLPIAGVFAWGRPSFPACICKLKSSGLAMIDNMEWASGLSSRFGIQYVNYTSLERHYKRSAFALVPTYNPK